jgi:hypothetical protein
VLTLHIPSSQVSDRTLWPFATSAGPSVSAPTSSKVGFPPIRSLKAPQWKMVTSCANEKSDSTCVN